MFKYFSICLVLAITFGYLTFYKGSSALSKLFDKQNQKHEFVISQAKTLIGFDLVDPEQAPPNIRDSVMRGYSIIMDTPFFAPKYAKDLLSCTSCHFCGGDTIGGRNNGISLVGVTNIYPSYSKRDQKFITLAERINNCFERSMSGKPMPLDSQEMKDLLNYLNWISKEVKEVKNPPWLGLKMLKSRHKPNLAHGEFVFNTNCSSCHGDHGQGGGKLPEPVGKTIPPLWGDYSFNDGAGMSNLEVLSAFIYWNMPDKNSILTENDAIDVAAFLLNQPRPHFVPSQSKLP
jgi:thiosulfate dehydrogenase